VKHLLFLPTVLAGVATTNAQPPTSLNLAGIDAFIFQQMTNFDSVRPTNQPPLIQSWASTNPSEWFYYRGFIYDQSVAICYLLQRGHTYHAWQLADAILFLQQKDTLPDGHLHVAYYYCNNLLNLAGLHSSVMEPDIRAGDICWAGISLARTFAATGEGKYLNGATNCAGWVLNNLMQTNGPGGFSGGFNDWSQQPIVWRSTEHNIDAYVLAMNLYPLTHDTKWLNMANHAANFVKAMYNSNALTGGYYRIGTKDTDGVTINHSPVAADAQSWTALAGMDSRERATNALAWLKSYLWDSCEAPANCETNSFQGVKFSDVGTGVDSLQTASAAMAFSLTGQSNDAQALLENLSLIQSCSPGTDGNGIVASPCPNANSGWDPIPCRLNVAVSAWAGCAKQMATGDLAANPFELDSDWDGVPDWWVRQYFGHPTGQSDDMSRASDDAIGTGQNNLFKYAAGIDPTDPASVFRLRIEPVITNQKRLVFSPLVGGRTYTLQSCLDLHAGSWESLASAPFNDNGNERTVTDTNATESKQFYRIHISLP
jgi:hypothetical protein